MNSFLTPSCITAYVIRHTSSGPRYLLIKRCCGGYLNNTWQMVTGGIDEGETAIQTALREIQEETGLQPTRFYSADAVETFFIHSRNKLLCVPVFVAFVEKDEVQLCKDEHDAYEWLPFEEARERLVWAEQRRIIAHVHERFVLRDPDDRLLIPLVSNPIQLHRGAYGVAITNNKILLIKQKKGPHAGKYDLPGGRIEPGESAEEALRREFQEEIGMAFESMEPLENLTAVTEWLKKEDPPSLFRQIGLIYRINGLAPLPNQPSELEHFWVDIRQIPNQSAAPFVEQIFNRKEDSIE